MFNLRFPSIYHYGFICLPLGFYLFSPSGWFALVYLFPVFVLFLRVYPCINNSSCKHRLNILGEYWSFLTSTFHIVGILILLSIYPFILLSFYPSFHLSFCLSIPLSFYLSILLSFYPSILLSFYPSILLSFYLSIPLSSISLYYPVKSIYLPYKSVRPN